MTLPPEMSRIATRSPFGYIHFPKGGAIIDFGFLTESVYPVFYTSEKYSGYTHKVYNVISMCLKPATPQ